MADILIREAGQQDVKQIFSWRNLPEIVALSHLQKTVTWQEHHKWYKRALSDKAHDLFIISCGNEDVGLIRFYSENLSGCDISIYVVPGYERKGIGSQALSKGLFLMKNKYTNFIARIRKDNVRSIAFFEKLGFFFVKESDDLYYYLYE